MSRIFYENPWKWLDFSNFVDFFQFSISPAQFQHNYPRLLHRKQNFVPSSCITVDNHIKTPIQAHFEMHRSSPTTLWLFSSKCNVTFGNSHTDNCACDKKTNTALFVSVSSEQLQQRSKPILTTRSVLIVPLGSIWSLFIVRVKFCICPICIVIVYNFKLFLLYLCSIYRAKNRIRFSHVNRTLECGMQ